jgi:hypothetical protein
MDQETKAEFDASVVQCQSSGEGTVSFSICYFVKCM